MRLAWAGWGNGLQRGFDRELRVLRKVTLTGESWHTCAKVMGAWLVCDWGLQMAQIPIAMGWSGKAERQDVEGLGHEQRSSINAR